MIALASFVSGLIFGVGLIVAGMANPAKVLGFLDITGRWDPSLALVMAGAILVGLFGFTLARRRTISLLGLPIMLPPTRRLDRRLIAGSVAFGVGWGLGGICPGPALVLVGAGVAKGWIFAAAMLAGMGIFEILDGRPLSRIARWDRPWLDRILIKRG